MWFFILAELTVFAILILTFAVTQRLEPEVFALGRSQLDSSTGLGSHRGAVPGGFARRCWQR